MLKERIKNKEKLVGMYVQLSDISIARIAAMAGYDFIWVDTEHSYMSLETLLGHIIAIRGEGVPVIVRAPQNDLTATKKVLEMAPDGVIFPMVRSAEELKELLDMTLYPPLGNRGFGPLRAIGYGAEDAKEYVDSKNLELCRFVQIEHIDFIEELEEIVKIPYVDGFIFGPNDLSASLGDFLNVFEEKTYSKIEYSVDFLKKHNKLVGIAGGMTEKEIKNWSKLDIDMLFAGADWCFDYNCGKSTLELMKDNLK